MAPPASTMSSVLLPLAGNGFQHFSPSADASSMFSLIGNGGKNGLLERAPVFPIVYTYRQSEESRSPAEQTAYDAIFTSNRKLGSLTETELKLFTKVELDALFSYRADAVVDASIASLKTFIVHEERPGVIGRMDQVQLLAYIKRNIATYIRQNGDDKLSRQVSEEIKRVWVRSAPGERLKQVQVVFTSADSPVFDFLLPKLDEIVLKIDQHKQLKCRLKPLREHHFIDITLIFLKNT